MKEAYKIALAALENTSVRAVPVNAGKGQRRFIAEVNSRIPVIGLASDTVIEFYNITYERVSEETPQSSFTSFGLNRVWYDRAERITPSVNDYADAYLEFILAEIWMETAMSMDAQRARSLCGSDKIYKLETFKKLVEG